MELQPFYRDLRRYTVEMEKNPPHEPAEKPLTSTRGNLLILIDIGKLPGLGERALSSLSGYHGFVSVGDDGRTTVVYFFDPDSYHPPIRISHHLPREQLFTSQIDP